METSSRRAWPRRPTPARHARSRWPALPARPAPCRCRPRNANRFVSPSCTLLVLRPVEEGRDQAQGISGRGIPGSVESAGALPFSGWSPTLPRRARAEHRDAVHLAPLVSRQSAAAMASSASRTVSPVSVAGFVLRGRPGATSIPIGTPAALANFPMSLGSMAVTTIGAPDSSGPTRRSGASWAAAGPTPARVSKPDSAAARRNCDHDSLNF